MSLYQNQTAFETIKIHGNETIEATKFPYSEDLIQVDHQTLSDEDGNMLKLVEGRANALKAMMNHG